MTDFSSATFLKNFYQHLFKLTQQRKFLIAYSGGLDSSVLLHSMVMLRSEYPDLQLRAIHINHSLSPNAKEWERHCAAVCQSLQVELITKKIQIFPTKKQSLEADARKMRYQLFAELINNDECLLTAHTKNDQAETVLLQLFRGAGPKGLAAMPAKIHFTDTYHLRPLLEFTREQLQNYATQQQLTWVEDESNLNLGFSRNFVRHELMPLISKRWPGILSALTRSARHCADADKLLTQLAEQDLLKVQGTIQGTLSIAQLLTLHEERQRNILRAWLNKLKFPLPSEIKIIQIQQEILFAKEDAKSIVKWRNTEVRRYQDNLYAMSSLSKVDRNFASHWDLQSTLILPGKLGELISKTDFGKGLRKQSLDHVVVRFRRGGERCHPHGRVGSHPLKKLFQEWQIPVWQRDRIPLIFYQEQLIAVVGYCICENFAAEEGEEGIVIELKDMI